MHLHAAIVPPPSRVEAVLDVLRSLPTGPLDGSAAGTPLRRLLSRGRRSARSETTARPSLLDLKPIEEIYLPIAIFGNVTSGDASTIASALAEACSRLEPPSVRFHGGLVRDGAREAASVYVTISSYPGQENPLGDIGRAVLATVERLGLFCDRRLLRPELAVALVSPSTTRPDLGPALAALDAFHGNWWDVGAVSLMRRSLDGSASVSTEIDRFPLGTSRADPPAAGQLR